MNPSTWTPPGPTRRARPRLRWRMSRSGHPDLEGSLDVLLGRVGQTCGEHHAEPMASTTPSLWRAPRRACGEHHDEPMASTTPSLWRAPRRAYGEHHAELEHDGTETAVVIEVDDHRHAHEGLEQDVTRLGGLGLSSVTSPIRCERAATRAPLGEVAFVPSAQLPCRQGVRLPSRRHRGDRHA